MAISGPVFCNLDKSYYCYTQTVRFSKNYKKVKANSIPANYTVILSISNCFTCKIMYLLFQRLFGIVNKTNLKHRNHKKMVTNHKMHCKASWCNIYWEPSILTMMQDFQFKSKWTVAPGKFILKIWSTSKVVPSAKISEYLTKNFSFPFVINNLFLEETMWVNQSLRTLLKRLFNARE